MEQLNINELLDRKREEQLFIDCITNFENNKNDILVKRGIYIYGAPGSGKTTFVKEILKKLNYDVVLFDAGDIRNKSIIENITNHNMSEASVISMFSNESKKIAIIMDEIDGMNGGDKGGINSLIKLIRPKKTKKQKKENISMSPIICIGNYHVDKKITEMMKVCVKIEIKTPCSKQIHKLIDLLMPNLDSILIPKIIQFIQGDLRKLQSMYDIYSKQQVILQSEIITNMFKEKSYNEDTKQITNRLLEQKYPIEMHHNLINETDRTSVGLLFHENVIDVINSIPKKNSISFYTKILDNICFSDFIDRVTFQKQIWLFNEISSLIKTFYNHKILHDTTHTLKKIPPSSIRFTKVLTKYSTEYNNMLFLQHFCEQLSMDRKDVIAYFRTLRLKYTDDEIYELFDTDNYEITKLDINRMFRFIDGYLQGNLE
jgi:replication factor C subunit 1